jgi:hypothetical protein
VRPSLESAPPDVLERRVDDRAEIDGDRPVGTFPTARRPSLRRVLLPKSRCHIYFEIEQVAVDLELVQVAFEDRDGEGQWFLDTETGDAVRVNEDDDEDDELRDLIEEGFGERFIGIPYQGCETRTIARVRLDPEGIEPVPRQPAPG